MLRTFLFLLLASAEGLHAVTLSLEETPSYAERHNPQLKAAALRIDEARARVLGAGRRQNPELDFEFAQNARMPERSFALGFMQRFPVTDRLQLEIRVTRAQLAAAEAEVRDARRKIANEARLAAIKYVALDAQRELREEQIRNSKEQADFVRKRVGTGEASAVDSTQVELDVKQLSIEVLQLETERATISGELRSLLGVPARETVRVTGKLSAPGKIPGLASGSVNRPDVEAARHTIAAARESISLARARAWEDVGAGIHALAERTEDAPDGFSNDFFLGFRVNVPLPFWNRNEGGIAEAQATAARLEKELAALNFAVRSEAEAARGEMRAFAELIADMDAQLLPQAATLEEQLRSSYVTGQAPLTEVLRARARRLELSQRRLDALRNFHLARARWDAAVGQPVAAKGGAGK
jgi:outer membrane protein, heavy metal efflux system